LRISEPAGQLGSSHLQKGASGLGKEGIAKDGMAEEVMCGMLFQSLCSEKECGKNKHPQHMPTPRQILVSSAGQDDWVDHYTACFANNIDMSIVFASPAFQKSILYL